MIFKDKQEMFETTNIKNKFLDSINSSEVGREPIEIKVNFKKKGGKWVFSSNKFVVLKLYLAFYTGTDNIFELKKMMDTNFD